MKTPNNLTILRFAHAYTAGGGMERYLEDLDMELLSRNSWTIIRFYLTGRKEEEPSYETVDRGFLIRIPLFAVRKDIPSETETHGTLYKWKQISKDFVRDHVIYHPLLYRPFFQKLIKKRRIPTREIEVIGARDAVSAVFRDHKIDLLVMHYIGGQDSAGIISEAIERNIPYVVINHFSNDRFNHLTVREQIESASAIGGVSEFEVPRWLERQFFNLSDGIDTEFFKRDYARPIPIQPDAPTVLISARLTPAKGQKDLVLACASLRKEGIKMKAALAGRSDSPDYIKELKYLARESGIEKDIFFLGELSPIQLRDWYAAATVFAFPTYHHEGLGRVLIESQAMHVPPISYIIGGTPAGIIHGKTGFLVKKGDLAEFCSRLRELLLNDQKRIDMGNAGRSFVTKYYSLSALASRHEYFYMKALKYIS